MKTSPKGHIMLVMAGTEGTGSGKKKLDLVEMIKMK